MGCVVIVEFPIPKPFVFKMLFITLNVKGRWNDRFKKKPDIHIKQQRLKPPKSLPDHITFHQYPHLPTLSLTLHSKELFTPQLSFKPVSLQAEPQLRIFYFRLVLNLLLSNELTLPILFFFFLFL